MILDKSLKLYIPQQLVGTEEVGALVRDMAKFAGGMTVTRGAGMWYGPDGEPINDPVAIMHWWMTANRFTEGQRKVLAIAHAMLNAGESSVLYEATTGHETLAHIVAMPLGED